MTTSKTLPVAISNLTIWRKGDQRAPHKPLLLLYVEYCTPQKGSKEPPKRELIENNVAGGFDQESYQLLRSKPRLIDKFAGQILSEHFPESIQEIIANRLDFALTDLRKERDPNFRQSVLRAYNYQCAICGYNLRHDSTPVGLEAAHIKWKQYGGPCTVSNGLALCSLHHSAFDMGAIGLDDNMKLLVSEGVNGSHMVDRLFWYFAGHALLLPKNREHYPSERFVKWHQEQVFRK